ncbi:MAG: PKD domain-containing protein, partial [Phototrophicaceae bacterium]
MQLRHRASPLFIITIGIMLILSACNLGTSPEQQEATLTTEPDVLTVQATTTAQAEGGVTVFPTITPFAFSTRPVIPPTSIVLVPNNPAPPTNTPAPISIVIVAPLSGNIASGTVQVVGSASHPNFLQYRLEYAQQNNPNNLWFPITGIVQQRVLAGVLGVWSTNSGATPDGLYQLRLRVFLRDGTQQTTQVGNIRVQNQQPTPVPTNTTTPRPIAAFTQNLTVGSAPLIVNFFNQSQGQITSYSWSFGDGGSSSAVNPTYTYRQPGTYTVTLRLTGPGGTSNVSRQISVNSPAAPTAAFTPSIVSGEPPLTVIFTNNSTGQINAVSWDFGDGSTSSEQNPTHVFNNPGTYNVVLRVAGNGGSSSLIRAITVEDNTIAAPIASFTADSTTIETGETVAFTNTTSGESTSFLWDFDGNGLTDNTDISPTHTYNTAGVYNVRLTAIGDGGQTDSVVAITVQDPPDAPSANFDLSVSGDIAPVSVDFVNTTTGNATTYAWNFGDGRTSSEQNPTITYETPGTYLVTLTASGPGGATTTEEVPINVEQPLVAPVADFTADPESGSVELTVNFSNASDGSGLSYAWTFGDGGTSIDENPTHVYTAQGSYTVTLIVTDPQNQVDTAELTINVSEPVVIAPEPDPSFVADPNPALTGQSITFSNTSLNADSYSWDFGDGGSSTEVSPSYTYSVAGNYTVTLTATGSGGTQTTTTNIVVNAAPEAPVVSFTANPNPVIAGESVIFNNTTLNADSYIWDFGDGGSSIEISPSYSYVVAGTYTVELSATGAGGTETTTLDVVVEAAPPPVVEPVAAFTGAPNPVVAGNAIAFSNTSTDALSYAWDFGDGGSSTEVNPSYSYAVAGNYTVSLTATGAEGSTPSSATLLVTVESAPPSVVEPVAAFTGAPNPVVEGNAIAFSNTSTDALSYAWEFGDGGSSTEVNPSYSYAVAGNYTVSLTATGAEGSTPSTATLDVVVEAAAPVAPTGSLTFISNSGGNLDIYVADSNGQNAVNITNTGADEFEPAWSPDGTKIAYAFFNAGDYDIFVFDLNTMSATQITTNPANDRQPAWSPDGTRLAFASDR